MQVNLPRATDRERAGEPVGHRGRIARPKPVVLTPGACPGPEPGYQSESRSVLAYLEAVAGVRHHIDITGRAMVGITTYDAATEAGGRRLKILVHGAL